MTGRAMQRRQGLVAGRVKLSEIFTSIEGEGVLFGTKTMFVRLAGCPLNCHWCDTPYAIPMDSGGDFSTSEVKEMIAGELLPNTYKVNFTGGEPLVQHEAVIELAKFVKEKGIRTYLESACYDSVRFAKVLP
ncbi:MAG: 4Fe-4S cluster-binding domain-containing protein, partial [Nitrososphaera sp.]|uniref:4Fe-4S cluster-binding domain-containing protein n=1 Tax=Nitrososphaera sp. TaxID=1971748 RepID=UPI003D6E195E